MSDGIECAKATLSKDTRYVTLTWSSGMPIENEMAFSNGREGPRNSESTRTSTKNSAQILQKDLQTGRRHCDKKAINWKLGLEASETKDCFDKKNILQWTVSPPKSCTINIQSNFLLT